MSALLKLDGVHTHIGSYHILHGVDFEVPLGQVTMLLGRNGAGKTTTLRTIMGLWHPRQGSIRYAGQPIHGRKTFDVAQLGIGYVPEYRGIFRNLTVEENLRLAERRKGDLRRLRALSGGQQQMLAIARALVPDNRLLLIDEPTEGLAPKIVDEIFGLMEGLRRDGIPILLVEQNMHRAIGIVQRFYVLERGAVVLEGDGGNTSHREALVRQLAV